MKAVDIAIRVVALLIIAGVGWLVYSNLQQSKSDIAEQKEIQARPTQDVDVSNVVVSPFPPPSNQQTTTSMQDQIKPITQTVTATLKTSKGDIVLKLDGKSAPLTVGNFVALAEQNFYDGTTFHRVIPGFMIQGGDPLSKDQTKRELHGTGGPVYMFQDEINDRKLVRGSIAMANRGPNTNGSQFFIVTAQATPHLDGLHTNFGEVVEGMDVVDAISNVRTDQRDNPVDPIIVEDIVIEMDAAASDTPTASPQQ